MKKLFIGLLLGLIGAVGVAGAAVIGDPMAAATNGAVAVATSATPVPAVASIMLRRNGFAIFNNGPDPIFCGWSSAATTATGFPIAAGGSLSIDVRYQSTAASPGPRLYCITTVLQVSPADTRYIEIK